MLNAVEPDENSAASGFLFICLKTLPEIELRNDIGEETVEALGSLLPPGLGYPWAVFYPSPSFCSSVHSLMKNSVSSCVSQCFFCFLLQLFLFYSGQRATLIKPQ